MTDAQTYEIIYALESVNTTLGDIGAYIREQKQKAFLWVLATEAYDLPEIPTTYCINVDNIVCIMNKRDDIGKYICIMTDIKVLGKTAPLTLKVHDMDERKKVLRWMANNDTMPEVK